MLRSADLMALPAVDCDKAFAMQLQLEDTVLPLQTIYFQVALLYPPAVQLCRLFTMSDFIVFFTLLSCALVRFGHAVVPKQFHVCLLLHFLGILGRTHYNRDLECEVKQFMVELCLSNHPELGW